MEILEPKDFKPLIDYKTNKLKKLGEEEVYIEIANVPSATIIPILFGKGTLEDKAEKLKSIGVDAEIIK